MFNTGLKIDTVIAQVTDKGISKTQSLMTNQLNDCSEVKGLWK